MSYGFQLPQRPQATGTEKMLLLSHFVVECEELVRRWTPSKQFNMMTTSELVTAKLLYDRNQARDIDLGVLAAQESHRTLR
jgi:hypothetical protein